MMNVPDGWESWLVRHGAGMILFARQWVPGHADAEDVVQEAFVRFWRSREKAADPSAYLFTCVKRCALEWLRQRGRRYRRESAAARPEAVGDTLFTSRPEEAERQAIIETALAELPENQREVLVLKIWGGLSFPQIGESLSISANTAASRYRYGLEKLREQLAVRA